MLWFERFGLGKQIALFFGGTTALMVTLTKMDPKVAAEMRHAYAATTFDPSQIQPIIDLAAKYKIIPKGFDARELMSTLLPT